jgi:hypothetical protein
VKGPGPLRVSTNPAALTAVTSVVWSAELTALSTMSLLGSISWPPTITILSIIISFPFCPDKPGRDQDNANTKNNTSDKATMNLLLIFYYLLSFYIDNTFKVWYSDYGKVDNCPFINMIIKQSDLYVVEFS